MNTSQKIVGNLGIIEIVALAVGAGAAAYFVLHTDMSESLKVGGVALLVAAGVEIVAGYAGLYGVATQQ